MKRWNKEELYTLEIDYKTLTKENLEIKYNRSFKNICAKANSLGIKRLNRNKINPENRKEHKFYYNLRYRQKHSEKIKEKKLLMRYGITLEQFNLLLEKQNNLCPICSSELKKGIHTHVDHCHKTGKVRGLLCNKCNFLLGLLDDDINRLDTILKYLSSN